MKQLMIGEKVKLLDYVSEATLKNGLHIEVSLASPVPCHVSCFGLDAQKQLSDDRYRVFYNQKASPHQEIKLLSEGNNLSTFEIHLSLLPQHIGTLVFAVEPDAHKPMSQVTAGFLSVIEAGRKVLELGFQGTQFKQERAVILVELYFKDSWRCNTVVKGFEGGMDALFKHFGAQAPVAVSAVNDEAVDAEVVHAIAEDAGTATQAKVPEAAEAPDVAAASNPQPKPTELSPSGSKLKTPTIAQPTISIPTIRRPEVTQPRISNPAVSVKKRVE